MDVISPLFSSLQHDLGLQCLTGTSAGFLSHILYFIRGYHDTSILRILILHLTAYTALYILLGLGSATLISTSYVLALFASITVYRLFFHPLRRFPGPIAAKITKLYGPYLARNGKLHIEQNKLFATYGNIVRIGSNPLLPCPSIADTKPRAKRAPRPLERRDPCDPRIQERLPQAQRRRLQCRPLPRRVQPRLDSRPRGAPMAAAGLGTGDDLQR
jgi:hypothetical protein